MPLVVKRNILKNLLWAKCITFVILFNTSILIKVPSHFDVIDVHMNFNIIRLFVIKDWQSLNRVCFCFKEKTTICNVLCILKLPFISLWSVLLCKVPVYFKLIVRWNLNGLKMQREHVTSMLPYKGSGFALHCGSKPPKKGCIF